MAILVSPPSTKSASCAIEFWGRHLSGPHLLEIADFRAIYEVKDERSGMSLIAMQPLVPDLAYMPHIKAL